MDIFEKYVIELIIDRMWGLRERKVSRMTPRFLAQTTGWVEVSLTEMGVGDKEEWGK